ncbi:hypothetical protein CERZMDRAFT_99712 [Cercospora zeae-maydis SCOH1-5]|uniref:3'-5' exonuclease domain-containing protein n=1 Tax=Cercospora zeae-maydis SCOH1-5 TaxID=717836 RepID=A0A6A6FA53_9PEZI|nr:hypothetical protein CERZMDRAFT_99712 [Cercospora zeae-maydis SCOH1-5]
MALSNLHSLTAALPSLRLEDRTAPQVACEGQIHFVQTAEDVKSMVHRLFSVASGSQALYMDSEGVNLSRHGTISLLQVWDPLQKAAFLLDVYTLGSQAFTEKDSDGKTLKALLECAEIKKCWFDARNDADALYALFNVRLAGVVDIQLMEVASRVGPRHVLCSLAACIKQEQPLLGAALRLWQETKDQVASMFDP